MDLSLSIDEIATLLPLLKQRHISLLTLRLSTSDLQTILESLSESCDKLFDRLSTSIDAVLQMTAYFPCVVDDVNLVILSYLSSESLAQLFLVSKEVRVLATRQDIWRQRIEDKFKMDVGIDNHISNFLLYRDLGKAPLLTLAKVPLSTTATDDRFINFIPKFWPKAINEYEDSFDEKYYGTFIKIVVTKGDPKFLAMLVRQDFATRTIFGMEITKDIVLAALNAKKSSILVTIFRELMSHNHVDELLRFVKYLILNRECDKETIIPFLLEFPLFSRSLLKPVILRCNLNKEDFEKLLVSPIIDSLSRRQLVDIIEESAESSYGDHILSQISTLSRSVYLLRSMVKRSCDIELFRVVLEKVNEHWEVCTPKLIKLCFNDLKKIKSTYLNVILSYANSAIVPFLVQYAKEINKIKIFFIALSNNTEIRAAFINDLLIEDLTALCPQKYRSPERDKMISYLLKRGGKLAPRKK